MPTVTSGYPTAGEFMEIERDLIAGMEEGDPSATHFPDETHVGWYLEWTQEDNLNGKQQWRGINGEPPRVKPLGRNRYHAEPGVFGEAIPIDEKSMTTRSDLPVGPGGRLMPTDDMIAEAQRQLLQRRVTHKRWARWEMMVKGYYQVTAANGAVVQTDAYNQQVQAALVAWGTSATAKPLADFRAAQLRGRGTSANFGAGANAYLNKVTANKMLANTNQDDLAGKRMGNLATPLNLDDMNTILQGEGLPRVQVYDDGWIPEDTRVWQPWIPDDTVIVVGTRPSRVQPGCYMMTSNANNPGRAPGPYTIVDDNRERGGVPPEILVHDGHNGGVVVRFPGMLLRLNVG
jgi:hypothetical protein